MADALSRTLQGSYRKGEDPPDIYLDVNGREAQVEITRLAQYVRDDQGERPRASDDVLAISTSQWT